MDENTIEEEPKKGLSAKGIIWYIIAQAAMFVYYFAINNGLMKVQGLNYCYLGCFWPFTSS